MVVFIHLPKVLARRWIALPKDLKRRWQGVAILIGLATTWLLLG